MKVGQRAGQLAVLMAFALVEPWVAARDVWMAYKWAVVKDGSKVGQWAVVTVASSVDTKAVKWDDSKAAKKAGVKVYQ